MKTIGRTEAKVLSRLILCVLAILCVWGVSAAAQSPALPASGAPSSPANSGIHAVLNLDGDWSFQEGDDPHWSDPAFDHSSWTPISLGQPLGAQRVDPYSGYAWYRLRLQPQKLSCNFSTTTPLALFVTGDSVGQFAVYVNGAEVGHTRGMTENPREYQSPPLVVPLSLSGNAPIILAIRTWAGPTLTIRRGLIDKVELGPRYEMSAKVALAIGHQWNEHVIAAMVVTFLFICVAMLGAALYGAQRNHSEYLWLALLCLSVAASGAADVAFGLGAMSLSVFRIFTIFSGRVFMAVTLEFLLRFTGSDLRKTVRGVQIFVLLLPFVYLAHFEQLQADLSVIAEITFCALACVMLFRAWRAGRKEAGVMLLPFFLAATGDSVDTVLEYAASRNWISGRFASPRFYLGPIAFGTGTVAYTVFLGSLIAVILYRFVRVSQEEQRSAAEISAAKSVQALLIPTQLPSNRNFMLESAYLPVNGVGGDFFQVLPLKDDSLLMVVGDVSGKGLQAAMNSSTLVGALRNELSHDPATVLEHLNHVLLGAVSSPGAVQELDCAPCFATCLCARIYPDGTTTIANAGHLNPYRDGRELQLMPSLPLGVIQDPGYEQTSFRLNRGDRLVFLSDGVVEATNSQGELFGFERTQQVSHESARYIAKTAQHFGQTDDITVVSLYVSSRAAERASDEEAMQAPGRNPLEMP
jgi:Stage II sporulation protein E (SpoIIE)